MFKSLKPSPELPQFLLALVFLILGGWCVINPHSVEMLTILPEYRDMSRLSAIVLACFGAQAILVATVILWSNFTSKTYIVFGVMGSLPFFVFNYYFVFINPIFTELMVLDFIGNILILTTCVWGATRHSRRTLKRV